MTSSPRHDRGGRAALSVMITLLVLLLLFTNAATIYLLIKTGGALQDALSTAPVYIEQPPEEDSAAEPSVPISVMMDYAERDKISIEFLQRFFSDRIIIWADDKLHSLPVDKSLKKSDFNAAHIVTDENGIRSYEPDGEDISLLGIDVSSYQGAINWKKVKAAGVDYAIIRLGYRGYETGAVKLDSYYHTNMKNAAAAGVPTGVYFYSQAITVDEAEAEAELVIKNLSGYEVLYPVVFDMEEVDDEDARINSLTREQRTDITIAFCEKIKAAGYTPMVYGNIRWMVMNLELPRLESYDKWFAQYFKQPFFPYSFSMWQYTPRGRIDGIYGSVDLNMGFFDYAAAKTEQTE